SRVGRALQSFEVDDRVPDEKLFADLSAGARKEIQSILKEGGQDAGIFFGRKAGLAVVALAVSHRRLLLEKNPMVPGPDGKVVVRGGLLQPAASIRAAINRGRFGFAKCARDPSVKLPRFSFECPALPEDEAAWLEVAAFPPGRILGSNVMEMLVWPAGKPGKTYVRLAQAKASAAPAEAPSLPDLVQSINDMRKEAGLSPLRLADQESRTASLLAPHYFAAISGAEPETTADQVALGLRAGWDVDGTVRYGTFVSTWVKDAASFGDVLRSALARPFGREALLDPAAERVAIGTVAADKDQVLAAVLSTYALFDGYKHDKDSGMVMARLAAARAERGLG